MKDKKLKIRRFKAIKIKDGYSYWIVQKNELNGLESILNKGIEILRMAIR